VASGVTIYDIAHEAGISASTVSRVLNGSALVSGETSQNVLAIATRLGYSPRRIRRHASRAILHIVVFLPQAEQPQSHLFYDAAALFSGIQAGFGGIRAHLIVSLNNSIDPLIAKKLGDIDGCIFAFSSPPARLRALLSERGVPTVLINRVDDQFSYVTNDAVAGMRGLLSAVNRSCPDDRICFISVEDARPVAEYRASAIESPESGVTVPTVRWLPTVTDVTTESVAALYQEGFRVMMCVNDFVAAAVYDRLTQLGIRVPGDVGITGYDAAPVRGLLSKAITTVDLSVGDLGWQAADLLGGMIMERNSTKIERYIAGPVLLGETL
jgi:LacI family transcriptional regulator, galactose operon repressor